MSLISDSLVLAVKEQAAVAAAYLDLDAPESDETRENAIAILDEWTYGELDSCQVLLTDYLNDDLESVTEEILYIRPNGLYFEEGTYCLSN